MKDKPTIREALEAVVILSIIGVMFYFILILKVWVAENRLEINIFKTESGRFLIYLLMAFVLFYCGRYLFRYWKIKRDQK